MSLRIVPVDRGRGTAAFIDVAWRIPEAVRHPQWVPPLRMMVRDALDSKGNPFYAAGARGLFIALRNGMPVGRIAAIENRAHNDFSSDRTGFFGFFECVDDPEAAAELFAAAAGWLRTRGLTSMRGPVNPSTNYECGLLVDGFDKHPMFLTTWNPPHYEALLRGAGLLPVRDLLGYWLPYGDPDFKFDPRMSALAARGAAKAKLTFRDLRADRFWDEIEIFWDIYNSAWERNWGFVPLSRAEFLHQAKGFRHLLIPEFAFAAEIDGKPAGLMMNIPDFNQILRRIPSGRLFPFGIFKLMVGKSKIRTGRSMALGIKKQYRTGSILPLFMHEAARRAIAYGSPGAEASWLLEDNQAMRQPLESFGARIYRRWRIFERAL